LKKTQATISVETPDSVTEFFLSQVKSRKDKEKLGSVIQGVREKNYDHALLEALCGFVMFAHDRLAESSNRLEKVHGMLVNQLAEESKLQSEIAELEVKYHAGKSVRVAKKGGAARSAQFKKLEAETIRLYELGSWKSAPFAAAEITPKIVEFSRTVGGGLGPTTTKPLEWIRKHNRAQKTKLS